MDAVKVAAEVIRYLESGNARDQAKALLFGAVTTRATAILKGGLDVAAPPGARLRNAVSLDQIEVGALVRDEFRGFPLVFETEALIVLLKALLPSPSPIPTKKVKKK
jgi:hypothetical protein